MTVRHVALLRGINVGRAKRVAMADLKRIVERLGYTDVRTVLNSGNVVFGAPRAAAGSAATRIERAIEEELGLSARVVVLTAADVERVMAECPLRAGMDDPSRLFVGVLADAAVRARAAPLAGQDWSPDALALGTRAVYFHCPNGMMESRIPDALARALGDGVTTRNWATMTRLRALVQE